MENKTDFMAKIAIDFGRQQIFEFARQPALSSHASELQRCGLSGVQVILWKLGI